MDHKFLSLIVNTALETEALGNADLTYETWKRALTDIREELLQEAPAGELLH